MDCARESRHFGLVRWHGASPHQLPGAWCGRPVVASSTVAVCLAQHSAQLEVTAVRFWTLAEVTRIAIETNGEFRFRSDRLNNPDRLFYDLLGTKPRMGVRGVQTTPVGDKLLKRVRIAETQPGMTRVVLDLESPVDFTASSMPCSKPPTKCARG